jgi:riboflavin biosynthesis pyrimidine reductase
LLAELYAHPAPAGGGAWVRANFVASVDGAAWGADGRSGSINGPADLRVFRLLRALADVVLAGAGTVRAEGYGLPRERPEHGARRAARGQAPVARLAVVTRSGDLPPDTGLFDGPRPALLVTCAAAGAPALRRMAALAGDDGVLVCGQDDVDPAVAVRELARRGLPRVLCEGGPRLLTAVAAAGVLDELCLTWSPLLVGGDAPRVVSGLPLSMRLRLAHLLEEDGFLLGRWLADR